MILIRAVSITRAIGRGGPTKVEVIGHKTFLRRYKSLFERLEIRFTCKFWPVSLLLDPGGQKMTHKSKKKLKNSMF